MGIREWKSKVAAAASGYRSAWINYHDSLVAKRQMLRYAFSYVKTEKVPGDYLEFGVYEGSTFAYACRLARQRRVDCRFFAFDSFAGLPKPQAADADFERFREGQFRASAASFAKRLRWSGIGRERVVIVPGWFNETLTEQTRNRLGLTAASVILIDCDMYMSTVPVLRFITPLLTEGTVLLFDDWFIYRANSKRGEQGAALDWLASHPQIRLVEWHKFGMSGQGFIVNFAV